MLLTIPLTTLSHSHLLSAELLILRPVRQQTAEEQEMRQCETETRRPGCHQ